MKLYNYKNIRNTFQREMPMKVKGLRERQLLRKTKGNVTVRVGGW